MNKTNNINIKKTLFFLLISVAIFLHILFINSIIKHPSVNLLLPKTDEFNYHVMAYNLITEHSLNINLPVYPLYVWFLKFIYSNFNFELKYVFNIQHILTLISSILIYLTGKRLFGFYSGLSSSLIYLLYKMNFVYEIMRIDTNFSQCLLISALFLFVLTLQEKSLLGFILYIITGFALISLRFFLIIPFFLGIIYLILKTNNSSKLKFSVAAFLIIFLFIFNYVYFQPSDSYLLKFGIHAYLGNNQKCEGIITKLNDFPSNAESHAKKAIKIAYYESNNKSFVKLFWLKKVSEFIKKEPIKFIRLYIRKINLLFNNYEIANNTSVYWFEKHTLLKRLPLLNFTSIFILAIIGIFYSLKNKKHIFLFCTLIIITLTLAIFFICSRYRMPLIPFLSIYAGVGINELFYILKQHNIKRIIFIISLISSAFFYTTIDYVFLNKEKDIKAFEAIDNQKILINNEIKKTSNEYKNLNTLSKEDFTKLTMNLGKLKMYPNFFNIIDKALLNEIHNKIVFIRLLKIKAIVLEELFDFSSAKHIWRELSKFKETEQLAKHKIEELTIYENYLQ